MELVSSSILDVPLKIIIMTWYCKVRQTFSFPTRGEVLDLAKRIFAFQERLE